MKRVAVSVLENSYTRPYLRVLRPDMVPLAAAEIQLTQTLKHFKITKILDIGANTGQYAKLLRDKAEYLGDIVSIEPGAPQAAELRRQSEPDGRWSVHELAVGDISGIQTLNVMHESQFNSLLEPESDEFLEGRGHKLKEQIEVSVVTLGEILTKVHPEGVTENLMLKLDTQGTELTILKAGAEVLHQFAVIEVEVSFRAIYQNGASFHEISQFLDESGFRISAIMTHNTDHFPRLYDADAIFVRSDLAE